MSNWKEEVKKLDISEEEMLEAIKLCLLSWAVEEYEEDEEFDVPLKQRLEENLITLLNRIEEKMKPYLKDLS